MGLLDSIFGGSGEEKSPVVVTKKGDDNDPPASTTTSLFEKKIDVELKPLPPRSSIKKRKGKESAAVVVKERKKPKTTNNNNDDGGDGDNKEETTDHTDDVAKNNNDNPAENASSDDVEERTIFVGNLPIFTTRKDLQKLFNSCGPIVSTRIRSVATMEDTPIKLPDHQRGNERLYKRLCIQKKDYIATDVKKCVSGYVVFKSKDSIDAALKLNNTKVPNEKKTSPDDVETATTPTTSFRHIRVDTAKPTIDPERSIFIGNLPYKADEESLFAHFIQNIFNLSLEDDNNHDIIQGVRVIRDSTTYQCKGIGYILFSDRQWVMKALQHDYTTNYSQYMRRTLRVQVCGKRFKNKKGKSAPTALRKQELQEKIPLTTGAQKRIMKKELQHGIQNPNKVKKEQEEKAKSSALAMINAPLGYKQGGGGGTGSHKKRKRGATPAMKKATKPPATSAAVGMSKREMSKKKSNMKAKKLEKRLAKGMGKARKK